MPKPLSPFDRVMRRTVEHQGCLLFTGSGTGNKFSEEGEDHGKVRVKKDGRWKVAYVHRVVYEHIHGQVPEGLVVRHLCHRRRCVEPTHLAVGTANENMQDMMFAQRGKNQFKPNNPDPDQECPF